jgi:hypothetical protein
MTFGTAFYVFLPSSAIAGVGGVAVAHYGRSNHHNLHVWK